MIGSMNIAYVKNDPLVAVSRKHPTDAGVDVRAAKDVLVWPFSFSVVQTGVKVHIPHGYMIDIRPKSRNNHLIGAGVVDEDYQGEILVKVVNYSWRPLRIKHGDPIAQLVLVKIETPELTEVHPRKLFIEKTARGATGGIVTQK